jgi:hypothetical protein
MRLTVGPLSPGVYWRRRAAVAAVLMAVLFGFTTCATRNSDASSRSAAAKATTSPAPSETAAPRAVQASTSATPVDPASTPTVAAPGAGAPAAAVPDAPVPNAKGAAPMCTDDQLELTATLGSKAKSVRSGTMPKLHLIVRNAGATPCRRDLGADEQELRVMDGTRRLWSSDDCQPLTGSAVWTLAPGAKRTYTLTWSGKDSTPGCTQVRRRLEPGRYDLVARLSTMMSDRTTFTIV